MSKYSPNPKTFQSIVLPGRDVNIGGELKFTKDDIEKEREFTRKKDKIIQEFKKVDRNSDEHITMDEWLAFMQLQVWPIIKYLIDARKGI